MLRIGTVHSEVVVGGGDAGQDGGRGTSTEVQVEELREVVRMLIDEELERRARTTPFGQGWSPQ